MSTSVNTEESGVNMDEGVALPEDFRGNASSIGHPLGGGGPRANSTLNGDLYGDLND